MKAEDSPKTPDKKPFLPKVRFWTTLYVIMLPTIVTMGLFGYYPKIDVVIKSMFRWQPELVEEFIGFDNFIDAFNDPIFWQSFQLVGILLVANLIKLWPGIFAAIALHRLFSARARYIYQVLFVIPMVIPALVWLLIWKSFYDPDFGILNRFLDVTGLMNILHWMDGVRGDPGVMPRLAGFLGNIEAVTIVPLVGSVWAMVLAGAVAMTLAKSQGTFLERKFTYGAMLALSLIPVIWRINGIGFNLVGALVLMAVAGAIIVQLARRIGGGWIIWSLWFLSSLFVFQEDAWRFPVILGVLFVLNEWVRSRKDRFVAQFTLTGTGLVLLLVGSFFIFFAHIWTEPTGQFIEGTPAWLGNKDLVIPAVVFWGFPWVNTVGVLIYLAGLQQISTDVYEAAELDGIGPIGMMFRIELPLIMTQVRINLIFMTIATLTQYEFFLLLLGPDGGPGNRGMVPGLYMFKKAFEDGRFGYACALGMVLFVLILVLTIIYNKYVKVEK